MTRGAKRASRVFWNLRISLTMMIYFVTLGFSPNRERRLANKEGEKKKVSGSLRIDRCFSVVMVSLFFFVSRTRLNSKNITREKLHHFPLRRQQNSYANKRSDSSFRYDVLFYTNNLQRKWWSRWCRQWSIHYGCDEWW